MCNYFNNVSVPRFDLHSPAWGKKFAERQEKEEEKKRAAAAREARKNQPKVCLRLILLHKVSLKVKDLKVQLKRLGLSQSGTRVYILILNNV